MINVDEENVASRGTPNQAVGHEYSSAGPENFMMGSLGTDEQISEAFSSKKPSDDQIQPEHIREDGLTEASALRSGSPLGHETEILTNEKGPSDPDPNISANEIKTPRDGLALPLIPEDDFHYPEGGLKAWLVVFVECLSSEDQLAHYSADQIGWIFSLYTFLTFVCGIYIGPLFDVYGPRYLVLPGSICVVLSMFLLGVCTEYWHFIIVFGIIAGIGTSLLFTPSIAAVGHYFFRRRGNATGIAAAGGAVGGIVFPLTLQALIPKIGFAWSTRIMGFIILLLCVVANLLITSRLPKSSTSRSPHPDFKILAQPAFAWTVVGVFLLEWALFFPLTYITSYSLQEHYSTAFAYQILPILNVGSVFGRWLPGFYSDFMGRFNTTIAFTILTIFSIFAVWLPFGPQTAGLVVFALLFGFASGSNISLTPVYIGQLCETKDYGRYYTTCYTIVSLGSLTGIPIAGAILDRCHESYWGLIVWTGSCYVGALMALGVARGLGGGWKFWIKF